MVAAEQSVTKREDDTVVPERERESATFSPQIDIIEKSDSVEIVADMPGVTKQNVDIMLEEGVLTIEGHVHTPEEEDLTLQRQEYEVGDFYRRFAVGEGLDVSEDAEIDASIDNGVLRLSIPKSKRFQPRRIDIQ